jgi:hypothetical protein
MIGSASSAVDGTYIVSRGGWTLRSGRVRFVVLSGFLAALVLVRTSAAIQEFNDQDSAKPPQVSQAQQAPDVEGKWLITFDAPRGEHLTWILTLHRDNGGLTGTLNAPVCPCRVSGSINGDKLKLEITPHTRAARKTTYTATVMGDTMTGVSHVEGLGGQGSKFRGVRQVQNDPPLNPAKG